MGPEIPHYGPGIEIAGHTGFMDYGDFRDLFWNHLFIIIINPGFDLSHPQNTLCYGVI